MTSTPYHNIAEIYDAIRPGYPQELIEDMVVCSGLSVDSVILEIGAGTGKATEHLLSLGCEVDAVEMEPAMAELMQRKLRSIHDWMRWSVLHILMQTKQSSIV